MRLASEGRTKQISGMRRTLGRLCAMSIALTGAVNAKAQGTKACYDAIVKARIIKQIPSAFPDCGPDCIVMSWPWFVDLDVKQILVGDAPRGRLLTLAVLHTAYRKDLGARRWWLRRNTLGGYHVLRFGPDAEPARCAPDSPPAKPFLDPGPNKTLRDLRTEARRAYHADD